MMFKRNRSSVKSIFNPTKSASPQKRRRRSDEKNWTVDILESGDPLTKIKHHRLGTFFVGVPKQEFSVRVTVHPNAWDLHGASAYKCKLYLDEKEVAARYMMKPMSIYDGGDVTWEFTTLPTGHAFAFANRKGGRFDDDFESGDKDVGKVRVTFQAAEEKFMHDFEDEFFGGRDNGKKKQNKEKTWDVAPQVKFDTNQKDNFGTLKTTKGRIIRKPRENSGSQNRGPKWNVNDYIYGEVILNYDSASHLEYRGILRPLHQKEHRYFFPNRDFSDGKCKKSGTVLDLTGKKVVERKLNKGKKVKTEMKKGGESEWISVFD